MKVGFVDINNDVDENNRIDDFDVSHMWSYGIDNDDGRIKKLTIRGKDDLDYQYELPTIVCHLTNVVEICLHCCEKLLVELSELPCLQKLELVLSLWSTILERSYKKSDKQTSQIYFDRKTDIATKNVTGLFYLLQNGPAVIGRSDLSGVRRIKNNSDDSDSNSSNTCNDRHNLPHRKRGHSIDSKDGEKDLYS